MKKTIETAIDAGCKIVLIGAIVAAFAGFEPNIAAIVSLGFLAIINKFEN